MEIILKPGVTLKDIYEIKRALYQGRAYNFYIIEEKGKPGAHLQLTEVLLSKLPAKECTEGWLSEQIDFLKELHDPLLPVIKDGFIIEGNAYLVLTYGDGISLDNYVNMNVSPLSVEESIERINKLIEVLKHLYNRPTPLAFIHIDPPHINISDKGDMMLMGFGLHIFMDHYLSSPEPYSFCAPEIAEGQTFSQKAAQFTLGTILYLFLTKKKWDSRKKDNPRPRELNKSIPENLQEIITTSLSRLPEYRYMDLENFASKLDEVINPVVTKKEKAESESQEEAVFVKESKVIKKNLKVAVYGLSALFLVAVIAFMVIGYIMDSTRNKESLFAYVLYGGKRAIHCIDLKSGNPLKVMTLPGKAISMNISTDGKRIFLPREENNFTILDAQQGLVINTYPLKAHPCAMLLSPKNEDAFICYTDESSISVWNRAKNEMAETPLMPGSAMQNAVISGDGTMICALSNQKEEVYTIDPIKKKVLSSLPAGKEPQLCALSAKGRILAVASAGPVVTFFDTQYNSVSKTVTLQQGNKHCAFSRGSELSTVAYICSEEKNMLYAVECSGYSIVQKTQLKGIPRDIRVSPDGNTLYVLTSTPNSLGLYDARSLKLIKEMVPGFLEPYSLSVWP
jgi:WD40 repeat protein